MNPQTPSGFGDVASAVGQHAMDVLPFGTGERRRVVLRLGIALRRRRHLALAAAERPKDVVRVRRLGKIIGGPQPDRVDCGGDAAKSGQHQDTDLRVGFLQVAKHFQTRLPGHAKIHDRQAGVELLSRLHRFVIARRGNDIQPAFAQGPRQTLAENEAVIH